jgi:hypothetical protein
MRLPILALLLIATAALGEMQTASAQSSTNYPWCARAYKMDTSATSCYFNTRAQCEATLSGIGGYCFESPYYHAALAKTTAQPKSRRPSSR